ncbi:hypothetical protein RB195_012594 [Necator americanus]|uniref:Uncharacterized protein n=1 Tax=Necator americanus TaxID=51031 RepID=A0ABR1DRK7_NECAM
MRHQDVLEKGTIIAQLNHKTVRNRCMQVSVDFDQLVGEPRYVQGVGWAVPCDVVGLSSKKAKVVKVRFHPILIELNRSDKSVTKAALKDALKYLDVLLENSNWTRHVVQLVDQRVGHLERIARFMLMRQPSLSFTCRSLNLIWSLHPQPQTTKGEVEKSLMDARSSLHNHSVVTAMVAKVKKMMDPVISQEVEVLLEKDDLVLPLLRLSLPSASSYLEIGTIRDCWQLTNNDCSLRISLPLSETIPEHLPLTIPREVKVFVLDNGKEVQIMMESCHLRVNDLRMRLDKTLTEFQRTQQKEKARALHIVRQNNKETIVEINKPGEHARLDRLLATSPLNVICCNSGGLSAVASSPADSTDSGVVISPQTSPFGSGKCSSFYKNSENYRFGMRQRSASECGDWDGIVLKSILKKPQRIDRFSRSKSESHHCCGDMSQLSLLMESTTEISESEGHTDNDADTVTQRKKRVSFSEKVQERRFRVGQCILTAARKNEKKRAYRKRKEERQRSLSEDNEDISGSDCSSHVADEKPGLRSDRQDSGFVDGDENDYEYDEEKSSLSTNGALINPEERWKSVVSQQREVATH